MNDRWLANPVAAPNRVSFFIHGSWVAVVGEADMWSHEYAVFYGHAFWNEGESLNLDPPPDPNALLDFDECANAAAAADVASVEIHQVGLSNKNVFFKDYIICDHVW